MKTSQINSIQTVLALGISLILWASGFAGVRASLTSYSPEHLVLLRFLVASSVLVVYALLTQMRLPRIKDVPIMLLLGFFGVALYHLCLSYGQRTITASAASLLNASSPIFTVLFATVFLEERLAAKGWIGIITSFIGAILISLSESDSIYFNTNALLIIIAAISQGIYFTLQKFYLKKYNAFELATYTIWGGTVLLMFSLSSLVETIYSAPLQATLTIAYLGVFPAAIAYMSWNYVISKMPVSQAASFLYLVPILASLIAWIWLKEIPNLLSVLGGVLVLSGVLLVNNVNSKNLNS
ncbi:DMT family transporter [Oculatella sp. LEGE 06141]|uniref:DMT family transporter n=1 Tax=Oculatella sp. LEGE 06141 TaxID=1828648 RepID=UPI00187F8232|nr:DMT family transporter [Oculatella sp. LEGE 06141]MBE9179339.1 DMT family transporter [Oculatella sp. LEGE 06141]